MSILAALALAMALVATPSSVVSRPLSVAVSEPGLEINAQNIATVSGRRLRMRMPLSPHFTFTYLCPLMRCCHGRTAYHTVIPVSASDASSLASDVVSWCLGH